MGDHGSEHDGAISGDPSSAQGSLPLNRDTDIVLSLADINKDVGQMASLLAKLCKEEPSIPLSSHDDDCPPGSKRKSTISDESDSRSAKRPRHSSSDDEVSIYASDDDEDLKLLTEQVQPDEPKARENDSELNSKLLQDLANTFEEEDNTGEKIQQQLADVCLKRWGKKLSPEKIKTLLNKYNRPSNCDDMKGKKVNPEIWSQLNSRKRKTDLLLSNIQQIIRKVTFVSLHTSNILVQNPGPSISQMIMHSVDSIAMLGHLNAQISQFRRDQIRPALKPEYSTICSADILPNSQYLFGDDLAKNLRDAKESSKISLSLAHSSNKNHFRGNQSSPGQTPHYSKGPRKDFLWKGQNRNYKRKKPQGNDTP